MGRLTLSKLPRKCTYPIVDVVTKQDLVAYEGVDGSHPLRFGQFTLSALVLYLLP